MADETLSRSASTRSGHQSPLKIYKPGQGVHVRWGTAIGAGIISAAGAAFLHEQLKVVFGTELVFRTLVPAVVLLGLAWLIVYIVGQRRNTVDFLIATEGEMKKVNWSSRREVLGATKVVIFTVFALGFMLAIVDLIFVFFFSSIGVLRIPVWKGLLGSEV